MCVQLHTLLPRKKSVLHPLGGNWVDHSTAVDTEAKRKIPGMNGNVIVQIEAWLITDKLKERLLVA